MKPGFSDYLHTPLPRKWFPPTFVKNPDLDTPLVYCWVFTGGKQSPVYFYVGKSATPSKRLGLHADAIRSLGNSLTWLGTNEKHRRVITKLGSTARLFIIQDCLFDSELRHEWEHWAIRAMREKLGVLASCNLVLTGLPTGRKLSREHRNFLSAKVTSQWEDPEFRRINSERIKRVLQEARDGKRVIRRKVHICRVYLGDGLLERRESFLVETRSATALFQLAASYDAGPAKTLPGILQGAISIVRQDRIDGRKRLEVAEELSNNYQEMVNHPFVQYVNKFRAAIGSYRTAPALIQLPDESVVRVPACRKAELPAKRIRLVKTYDNLWSFWKDAEKYPMKRMEQL